MNFSSKICKFVKFNRMSILSYQFIKQSLEKDVLISASNDGLIQKHNVLMQKLVFHNDLNKNPLTRVQTISGFAYFNAYYPYLYQPNEITEESRVAPLRSKIEEPNIIVELNIGLPISNIGNNDIELPPLNEKEVMDPISHIIEKKAHRMIKIRARKMKKFKRKKWLKKMKHFLEKVKKKKMSERENKFKELIRAKLDSGQVFDAQRHIEENIKILNWRRPITSVKGFLAPQWVIDEYLAEQKRKAILVERVDECLKRIK